jgi:hypothetical protein
VGDIDSGASNIYRHHFDEAVRTLMGRQSGNIARRQLLALGVSRGAIQHELRIGTLVTRYHGVYCQAPARQDPQALIAAAVLAGGPTAVASHASAAWLWDFLPHYTPRAEISLPTGDRRPRHILTHRCPSLRRRDMTHQRGVPATTPARTALDLAPRLSRKQLTRLVNDQLRDGYLTLGALEDVVQRNPLHPATKLLRPFVDSPRRPTNSDFEDEFLACCATYGLPPPEINFPFNGRKLDAFFPEHGLIVELDGWGFHKDKEAFENDRERDADHLELGLVTMRLTKDRFDAHADGEGARLHRILEVLARRRTAS